MLSLTLTTSSSFGSITLAKNSDVVETIEWVKQQSHSEKVTAALDSLFKKHQLRPQQLQLLICTNGPGSFTGIRVGLSAIRALAHACHAPIITVPDTLAIALNAPDTALPRLILIDAQKNKLFSAIYKDNNFNEISPPQLLSLQEIEAQLMEDKYLILGDSLEKFIPFFSPAFRQKVNFDENTKNHPDSQQLFNFVFPRKDSFPKAQWENLSPIYMRKSAAEEVLANKLSTRA